MTVDLSNLKLVEEQIEVADDASYVDAAEFGPPLAEGTYTFIQGKPAFKASGSGFLAATFDHTVSGGEQDGKKLMFDSVSAKPFPRSGVQVSTAKDHLRAVGDRNPYRTQQELANAIEAAEGKPFSAVVEWEAGCNHKDTDKECEWDDKQKVFRARSRQLPEQNGVKQSEFPCPTCGAALRARARIARRIAAA